jgi:hypothetical protein
MEDLALIVIHILATTAKLLGPGGLRAVMIENALLRQQLIVLRRSRRGAPNLTTLDRFLFGFGLLFLKPGRVSKVAIVSVSNSRSRGYGELDKTSAVGVPADGAEFSGFDDLATRQPVGRISI